MTEPRIINAEVTQLAGSRLSDRYLLEQFISAGGFGAVYRALDTRLGMHVAIKVGHPGTSAKEIGREAQLAASLNKRNVVQIYDYGTDPPWTFLVMEFLEGQDLDAYWNASNRHLPNDFVRLFVKQVCGVLELAHARNLIHRDLKPANVFVVDEGPDPESGQLQYRFVLLDFGIAAKVDDVRKTLRNDTMRGAGSIEYMSPEHLCDRSPTGQTDIYSFGVILYQLLTGTVPFPLRGSSQMALAECATDITREPPHSMRETAPDRGIPAAVDALVLQCLAKDPNARPQSISEVRDRFLRALPGSTGANSARTVVPSMLGHVAPHDPSRIDTHRSRSWTDPKPVPSATRRAVQAISVLMVLAVTSGLAWHFTMNGGRVPVVPVAPTWDVDRTSIRLYADKGAKGAEEFRILKGGETALAAADVPWVISETPQGIEAQLAAGAELRGTIWVKDPSLSDDVGEVVLTAGKSAGLSPLRIKLHVVPAELDPHFPERAADGWPRKEGWSVKPVGRIKSTWHERGTKIVAEKLQIDRDGFPEPIMFQLVEVTEEQRQAAKKWMKGDDSNQLRENELPRGSFYISEKKVSREVFRQFARENQDVFQGNDAFLEQAPNLPEETKPVTGVVPWAAVECCEWIAGKTAKLPSAAEWDWACGILVGNQRPGEPLQERVRGIDQLVGGLEWTCSRINPQFERIEVVPDKATCEDLPSHDSLRTRGNENRGELIWQESYSDWNASFEELQSCTPDDRVGFRVVISLSD